MQLLEIHRLLPRARSPVILVGIPKQPPRAVLPLKQALEVGAGVGVLVGVGFGFGPLVGAGVGVPPPPCPSAHFFRAAASLLTAVALCFSSLVLALPLAFLILLLRTAIVVFNLVKVVPSLANVPGTNRFDTFPHITFPALVETWKRSDGGSGSD